MKASVQLDVLDPTAVETGKPREQVLVEDSIVLNIQFNKLNVIENNDSLPLMVGTNDSEKDDWIIIISIDKDVIKCLYCSNPYQWNGKCDDIEADSVPGNSIIYISI